MNKGNSVRGVLLQKSRHISWQLPAIFLFLTITISISGNVYYQKQKNAAIREQTNQLKAIADLKAIQIRNWLWERVGDARLIQQNPIMIAELAAYLDDQSIEGGRNSIQRWMESMCNEYHYENVLLLDRQGEVVLSASPNYTIIGSEGSKTIGIVRRNRDTVLSDLHRSPDVPHIHMDVATPVLIENEIAGFVFLRINPADFLYPMIQSWPTPSPSAETLLVKRDGEKVLFLNELRHRRNTALTFRLSIKDSGLPAALAAAGKTGMMIGRDYRGVAVWSVSRAIPDTPWSIVAKVDREEIERPIRRSALAVLLVTLFLILSAALSILFLWQRQNAQFSLRQLEARRESEEKFRQVFETANVGKSITQLSGEINVNQAFCAMLGYSREELQNKKWQELTPLDEIEAIQKTLEPLLQGRQDAAHFNKRYIHKNGQIIWGDVSVAVNRDSAGKPLHFITTVVDITERKQSEEKIRQEQDLYMDLVNTIPSGMYRLRVKPAAKWDEKNWRSQMGSLYSVDFASDRFCEITGISRQEFAANPGIVPDRIHPDEKSGMVQRNSEAVNSLSTFSWEGRMIVPQRGAIWVRFESIPRKLANGEVLWTGIINDISERKRAEETIRESTARLRSILDATPFPIAIVDVQDNKIEFWSSSALALFGHTAPTAAEWYEMAYPDPEYRREVVERWKPFLEKARSSKQAVNTGEYRVTCRDGSVRICELHAAFLADNLIITFNDITERKRAEAAIVLNAQRVQTLLKLNQMNDASLKEITDFALDEAVRLTQSTIGYLAFLNEDESVLTMHSWSKSAMAECAIVEKPIEYPVVTTGLWGEAVRQRQAVITNDYTAANPLKKGYPQGHVAVTCHMNIPVFAGSRIVLVAGVGNKAGEYDQDDAQQLTLLMEGMWRLIERRRAEEALKESERKFRETIINLDEGYFNVTVDGILLEHNQAFNRILEIDSSRDLKGTYMPDFWQNPEDRLEYVQALGITGTITNYQINAKTQRGEKITVLASAHLVKGENNQPQRIEGVFMDISQRIRAELEIQRLNEELEQRVLQRTSQLEAANKELEAFSYSVSHDLRAPLRAIDGFSRIIVEEYASKLDNEGRRLLGVITANTGKMAQLIDDLLAFSRLSRQQLSFAPVDLAGIASSVFSELKSMEKGRRIEFKVGTLPVAHGDRSMLRLVLQNLLANACKFTRNTPKARIELSGRVEKGENIYQVKDNGVGFDMNYADKLFGVFQRLHGSDEFEGTGVGLAIVQRIVLRHEGRVWADSGKDGGATFYFSLPTGANPGMDEPAEAT